jgi:ketosteroid isomerase-like protein
LAFFGVIKWKQPKSWAPDLRSTRQPVWELADQMKNNRSLVSLVAACVALSFVPCFAQKSPDVSLNEKVVREYYAAYEKKDWHILELVLADNFTFTSPAGDDHINLATYKARCWPNAANTKRFEIEKLIVAGDDAYVTYNGWTNDGRLFRNTERFRLKDGKIVENECFFGPGVSFPNNQAKK